MKHNALRAIYSILIAFMTMFALNTAYVDDASAAPKKESKQDKDANKQFDKLVKDGAKAYGDGNYDEALKCFEDAYAIRAESSLLYNIGRVCEDNANYDCAIENYQKLLMSPGSDADAREDAKDRIKACQETLKLAKGGSSKSSSKSKKGEINGCIDVNTADASELKKLPNVGDATAKYILEYRAANGNFKSIDEMLKVKKIGPKTLEKLQDLICPIGTNAAVAAPAPAVAAPAPAPAAQNNKANKNANAANNAFDI